jgi:hypothetical protein
MTGPSNPLDCARHALGGGQHDHQINCTDIDPEFETGRTNHRAQFAVFEPIFNFESNTSVQRTVVDLNLIG